MKKITAKPMNIRCIMSYHDDNLRCVQVVRLKYTKRSFFSGWAEFPHAVPEFPTNYAILMFSNN